MRTFLMALAATLIALALLPGSATAAPQSVGHFRYAIDTAAGNADYSQTGTRNNVLVLQSYQVPLMQRLKAANPNLKILIYKDLSGMVERDQWGGVSTGVATQDAATHPEWFLQNTSGQRFTFRYYNWIWAADIGNAGYQQKWADNVLAEMGNKGWDGVFMDDTNPSMEYHYDVAQVAKYPTDAAYQAATGSALAAIGARFRSAGKLVIPNFGFWKDYPSVINGWLQHVDGGMNENFVKVGTSTAAETYDRASVWETQLQSIKDAETQGKYYLGVSHSANSDAAAARYGFATMLLAGGGNAHFALHGDYTNENWFSVYDYAIGTPAATETRDASGVHRRKFTNGLVLVNPTNSSVGVDFGAAYTGSGLTDATAATLPPHSALILAKAGGGAPFQSSRAKTARRTPVKAKTAQTSNRTRTAKKAATTKARRTAARARTRARAAARTRAKAAARTRATGGGTDPSDGRRHGPGHGQRHGPEHRQRHGRGRRRRHGPGRGRRQRHRFTAGRRRHHHRPDAHHDAADRHRHGHLQGPDVLPRHRTDHARHDRRRQARRAHPLRADGHPARPGARAGFDLGRGRQAQTGPRPRPARDARQARLIAVS